MNLGRLLQRAIPVLYWASAASTIAIAAATASAQTAPSKELFALHARGGFLKSWYTADFRSFQGAIDCGIFTEGDGQGMSLSLSGEYPIAEGLHIGLGIGYAQRGGSLINSGSFPARDTSTREVVTVHTENGIEATLNYLEIQPELRYTLIPNFLRGPLRAVAAARFGFPMTSTFEQKETIISPDNAAFTAGGRRTRERAIASGEIFSRTSMVVGASAGIENMLKIGSSLHFTQQVVFDYNFNDITTDASWKTYGLRLEAGLRYAFMSSPPAPAPEPPPTRDTVIAEKPVEKPIIEPPAPPPPVAVVRIDNVMDQMTELEIGNELVATQPLVNTVFFDKASAAIPERYIRTTGKSKPNDAVAAHRYILADIADIVSRNPEARITLQGATSGTDDEPAGRELAEARAAAVREALVALGVPDNTITVKSSLLPANPSNQEFEEGRQENRRVDIVLRNAPLQEYVAKRRYAELRSVVTGSVTLKDLPYEGDGFLTLNVADTVVRVDESGDFAIPIAHRLDAAQSGNLKVVATLKLPDHALQSTDEVQLPVASVPVREVELQLDSFEPILRFDYDKSSLSDANKDLLRQMVAVLPSGATITILGSADALGAEKRNAELSRDRALSVEKFIRSIAGNRFTITSSGAEARFPDASPEGRFLNRSIRVRATK